MLASDGTKLGIFFRNSKIEEIEKPDPAKPKTSPVHRRSDRMFFKFPHTAPANLKKDHHLARDDMHYFVCQHSGAVYKGKHADRTVDDRVAHLLHHSPPLTRDIIAAFIRGEIESPLLEPLVAVFTLCASEAPLSSLINHRFLQQMKEIVQHVQTEDMGYINFNFGDLRYELQVQDGNIDQLDFRSLKDELPEIYSLYCAAFNCDQILDVNNLVKYIIDSIQAIHNSDHDLGEGDNIVQIYNPERLGRAFYFNRLMIPHTSRMVCPATWTGTSGRYSTSGTTV